MSEMLPGKKNDTSLTSKTCQYWQRKAGGCQIILLPRRCYQRIRWLLQCNYLTYQICLEKVSELIPRVCNKSFSLANLGHIYNSCVRSMLLYTCQIWLRNVKDLSRLSKADNLMVKWICSVKISDRYSMNELREKLKFSSVQEHIKLRC